MEWRKDAANIKLRVKKKNFKSVNKTDKENKQKNSAHSVDRKQNKRKQNLRPSGTNGKQLLFLLSFYFFHFGKLTAFLRFCMLAYLLLCCAPFLVSRNFVCFFVVVVASHV